jgi:hypothetical protein
MGKERCGESMSEKTATTATTATATRAAIELARRVGKRSGDGWNRGGGRSVHGP